MHTVYGEYGKCFRDTQWWVSMTDGRFEYYDRESDAKRRSDDMRAYKWATGKPIVNRRTYTKAN